MNPEQNVTFVNFLTRFSEISLDVTACSCMSKWADGPQVALVSVAEGDEPFGSWILCNTRDGLSVERSWSAEWLISNTDRRALTIIGPWRTIWAREENTLTSFSRKISTEDHFIKSYAQAFFFFQIEAWSLQRVLGIAANNVTKPNHFWLKDD